MSGHVSPITVTTIVRFDSRELSVAEQAAGPDDVVPALNRARDQMVGLLVRHGLAEPEKGANS